MHKKYSERHVVILIEHRDEGDRHFEEHSEHRFGDFYSAWEFVVRMGKHARIFDIEGCEVYDHDPANKNVEINIPVSLKVHVR